MLYNKKYGFGKVNRDLAPDKRDDFTHFEVVNFETYLTDRGLSLQAQKGTGLESSLLTEGSSGFPYYVIGDAYIDNRLFIFCTKKTGTVSPSDPDLIVELIGTPSSITLSTKWSADMNFRTTQPIDAIGYKDSKDVSKLYWVDSFNQARFQDVDNPTPNIDFLLGIGAGGNITASPTTTKGYDDMVVRYGFSTYNMGGQSSKLSALSKPVNIRKDGGSALVEVTDLPTEYTNVRIYRLTYRTYNSPPSFDLIWDSAYSSPGNITYEDTGGTLLGTLSIEDMLSIGGDKVIPSTLVSKSQHLFFGNVDVDPHTINPEDWDTRAYQFPISSNGFWIKNNDGFPQNFFNYIVPFDHDCINTNDLAYRYKKNSTVLGASGPNIEITVRYVYSAYFQNGMRLLKGGEIYRVGVQYKDSFGRWSNALWCIDYYVPYLNGAYATLDVKFLNFPASATQAKVVIVERLDKDKTVVMQGVPQNVMNFLDGAQSLGMSPFPNIRGMAKSGNYKKAVGTQDPFDIELPYMNGTDYKANTFRDIQWGPEKLALVLSPENVMAKTDPNVTKARAVGTIELMHAASYIYYENEDTWVNPGDPSTATLFETVLPGVYTNPYTRPNSQFTPSGIEGTPTCLLADFNDINTTNGQKAQRRINYAYYRQTSGNIKEITSHWEEAINYAKFMDYDSSVVISSYVIHNSFDYLNWAGDGGATVPEAIDRTNLEGEGVSKYLVEFNNTYWAGGGNYSRFPKPVIDSVIDLPVIDLIRENPNQYGGKTFEVKSSNIYIDASEAAYLGDTVTVFGDTYVGHYAFPWMTGARRNLTKKYTTVFDYVYIQLEGSVDPLEYNSFLKDAYDLTEELASNRLGVESRQLEDYPQVFSQQDNVTIAVGKPYNFIEVTDYQYRVIPTLPKFPGALIDPWTEVLKDTYIDLEGIYGPISKLLKAQDNVIAFQPRAISIVKIYPTAQTTTDSGQVQLGKGAILDEYEIIKTDTGCSNLEAVKVVDGQVFFIDNYNRTLSVLADGKISALLGFNKLTQDLIDTSSPLLNVDYSNGQFVFVDTRKDNVYFRFSDGTPVLAYNYVAKSFSHSRTYERGERFIGFNNYVYSVFNSKIYRLDAGVINSYYGFDETSYLTLWVEPIPGKDKVFDALSASKKGEIFNTIEVFTDNRTSGLQSITWEDKFDIFNTHLPRVINSRDRWRVRNVKIKLGYTGSNEFELDNITLKFTIKK